MLIDKKAKGKFRCMGCKKMFPSSKEHGIFEEDKIVERNLCEDCLKEKENES